MSNKKSENIIAGGVTLTPQALEALSNFNDLPKEKGLKQIFRISNNYAKSSAFNEEPSLSKEEFHDDLFLLEQIHDLFTALLITEEQ